MDEVPSKVTKKLELDLRGMTTAQKNEVKDRIGEFIVDAIGDDIDALKSPVNGRGFKGLSKRYIKKKIKAGEPPIPNLELKHKMLQTLRYKKIREGVEVGIFAPKQAKKADNHNKFSNKAKATNVPKRQFIPKEKETFRPDIRKQLVKINREFRKDLGLRIKRD